MSDGIDLRFRRSNQTFGASLSFENDILSLLNNRGDVLSSVNIDLIKKEELPTANEDNLGVIYLYTGPDDEYKHGYFYECVENSGVYSWENIIVQDSYLKSETYSKTESDDSFVHKTGDETISDIKTFTGISAQDPLEAHMIIKNLKDDFRYSDGTKFYYISFRDKNNKECGYMGYNHTTKSSFIELGARKTPLGNLVTTLEVGFDDDGNAYTYAPKPTEDTTTSRQLDTVGARNTKLQNYQEKETAINYNNISNCITEIPQNIKLELNNGVLTLKAGSKVYVPNGSGVFDTITTTNDLTITYSNSDTLLVFLRKDGNGLSYGSVDSCVSGHTDSLAGTTYHNWYDTTNNVIHRYTSDASTPNHDCSLPLCIVTSSNGTISNIDQVFNGFGYIGSTIFALPGVKVLIPDGRNADGTLKSIESTVGQVVTQTTIATFTDMPFVVNSNGIQWIRYLGKFTSPPAVQQYSAYFNSIENKLYFAQTADAWTQLDRAFCGRVSSNGKITSFTPKTVFHAADYNDTEFIGHQAMPSDRYVDLTLGNDNDLLVAPADGYFVINKASTGAGQRVGFANGLTDTLVYSTAAGQFLATYCHVSKRQAVRVRFTADGTTVIFRFVYANGAK